MPEDSQPDNLKLAIGAILAACFALSLVYAVAMILTRNKCRSEKPTVLSLWLSISFIGVGALALACLWLWNPGVDTIASNPFLFGGWTAMRLAEWRTMGILATAILAGSVLAAMAYQKAPSSTVSIFDFSYVGFAAVWGYLFLAELAAPTVNLGILLITGSGIIASRRHPA